MPSTQMEEGNGARPFKVTNAAGSTMASTRNNEDREKNRLISERPLMSLVVMPVGSVSKQDKGGG
jgi:hypothetical protein